MDIKIKQSLIDIIKSCGTVQMSTFGENNYPDVRTLTNLLNQKTDDLNLYFITSTNSHKYKQIEINPNVCLGYFNPQTRMAIRLFGKITPKQDKDSREKYWDDGWKIYGFKDAADPNYSVLKFQPESYKFYAGPDEFTDNID